MLIWIFERPRIEDELRRLTRVAPPSSLRNGGLVVAHQDARRLIARIDRIEARLHRTGPVGHVFARAVEFLTTIAFTVIVLRALEIPVDERLAEAAHYEAPVGFGYIVFDKARLHFRKKLLGELRAWYDEVDRFHRACEDEIHRRLIGSAPRDPS